MKKSDLTKLIAIGAAVTAAAATTAIVISKHKKHKTMLAEHTKTLTKKQAYITGGGLSAFASALYLVRDCGFTPENIHIFTNGTRNCGNNETGFICRRGKTISIKDSMNFFDLISDVDSLDIPDLTVCDEILNIYRANIYPRSVTLIDQDKNVIDSSKIKVSKSHRNAILALMQSKRSQIQSASIFDVMDSDFFLSPFWKLISALYGFTEESSAYEFVNCIANMDNMLSGIIPNDFDRYEEIVNPLKEHLKKIGVDVRENAVVTDIDFENDNADSIHFTDGATRKTFYLNDGDICIMPTDEMADCESFGSFNEPAPKLYSKPFELWEKLAEKHIRILTGKAIVAESLLDTAALLLDEDAEIILVPEGCSCVKGDICLDQKLVRRYGKKLLITGNVTDAQTGVAAALEYLQVIGQAMIPESELEAFESVCESCSEVTNYKGKLLRDIGELAVDQKLLEAAKELTVVDCGCVRVVEGVTAEQIKDRLFLKDCGAVECAEELQGILRLQSDGVGAFSGKETAQGAENSTGEADGKVTKISAMKYVM